MKTKFVATGLAAGLVAGAGAGLILQSSGLAGAAHTPAVTVTVDDDGAGTGDVGAAEADLPAERGERLAAVLQPLVDDGTITADQLTAVVDRLVAALPDRGPGHGHGHLGRPGPALEAAAGALGLDESEVRRALREGSTLAELAAQQGVDVQAVVDALVVEATERVQAKVADGTVTQEQADARLAELTERITRFVEEGGPRRGR